LTAQIGEYLRYQGEGVSMATEPLEVFFAMGGHRPRFLPSHTALRRDYVGGWEIVGGRPWTVRSRTRPSPCAGSDEKSCLTR
jgi:hypothetical protein